MRDEGLLWVGTLNLERRRIAGSFVRLSGLTRFHLFINWEVEKEKAGSREAMMTRSVLTQVFSCGQTDKADV